MSPNTAQGIIRMLRGMGLEEVEVRHPVNRYGIPTGLRIVSIRGWDHRRHLPISAIADCLPSRCALELVFDEPDPEAVWMLLPPQPSSWTAPPTKGRRR